MLSCLGRIHGCGERRLASFLSRGISLPHDWPRRPKQLFFVQPTKENLEIVDKMNRKNLRENSDSILRENADVSEYFLGQQLVNEMPHPLGKFPYLYLYEWAVQYGLETGKGDFVFASGDGRFAIVEVKYVDGINRSRKRKSVWSQAQRYAVLFRLAAEQADVQFNSVIAFTYTNEDGLIYHGCASGLWDG